MIKVTNNGPTSIDGAADSYIERGSKDPLRTTSSAFDDGESDISGDGSGTGGVGASGGNARGTVGNVGKYGSSSGRGTSSGSSGIDALPGGSIRNDGLTTIDQRKRSNGRGNVIQNGPNSKYNSLSTDTQSERNPITGNLSRGRDSLGRPVPGKRTFGPNAMSLWTALLCGAAALVLLSSSRGRINLMSLWLRSTNCSAENLIDFLKIEGGNVGLDRKLVNERLQGVMGTALRDIDDNQRGALVQSVASASGQSPNTVEATFDGVKTAVRSGNVNDVNQLQKMLSGVTGANEVIEVFDMHAEVAVLGSILDKSIELGIPGAAIKLADKIKDDRVKQKIMINRVRKAALNSDLDFIQLTLNHTSAARIRSEVPDIVSLILKNYYISPNTPRSEYPALRTKLTTLIDTLDPDWHTTDYRGGHIDNLGPFADASSSAETLLLNTEHRDTMSVARRYPSRHIYDVIARYYPLAVMGYTS